jgi:hypothetical protein
MQMGKKRKKRTSDFWKEHGERFDETTRKLLERIAYHEKKAAEEQAARGDADAA